MYAHLKIKRMGGRVLLWVGALAASAVFSGSALAASPNAISTTKHNLSSSGTGSNHAGADGTDQICVFCHTPHGAENSRGPLWNKAAGGPFTTYSGLLSGNTVAAVGSVSLACLSCHDGSQAMDNMINAPGPGMTWGGAGSSAVGTAGTGVFTTDGKISGAANLGGDLSNDHPIGVAYGGIADTDGDDWKGYKSAAMGGGTAYWVDTATDGGAGARGRRDIQLYAPRDGITGPMVECGSCHDPHIAKSGNAPDGKGDASLNFMRVSTAGSAICLSCHIK
ncbi:MAG: hypothetical protein M0P39_03035 [Rhodocyclaceae bacterium]|jgi:hypothetical protein|nr:hypothetical protein [Rhodocyclaceae bacterium]